MNCADHLRALSQHLHDPTGGPELPEAVAHRAQCAACTELHRVALETSCRDLVSFLLDYVEDTLETTVRERFERHLNLCSACRSFLESYRTTLRGLEDERNRPPEPLPDELVRAILASLPSP